LAIHVAVIAAIVALLGGAGATYAHLRAIEGQVRAAVAQAYGPSGNGRPGSLPVDATAARAITARLAGVVSSLRVVPACRGGARVVTVRYREPGPPLGLGRDQTITLSVDGVAGCAGGGGARAGVRAPSR